MGEESATGLITPPIPSESMTFMEKTLLDHINSLERDIQHYERLIAMLRRQARANKELLQAKPAAAVE